MKSKKLVGKFLTALMLTFIIPEMVFIYIWEDLSRRLSLLILTSTVLLLVIGCFLIWDIIQSLRAIFKNIDGITQEGLKATLPPAEDEFKHVGNSIEIISQKIVAHMEELQHSAQTLEKTKKELSEALLYIENVVNSMGDALIVISPHCQIRNLNRAAQELLGYTENDVLNQPIDLLFEEIGQISFSKNEIIKGKRMTFITRENEKIPVELNVRPLLDPQGASLGYVLVARNMQMTLELISRLKGMNTTLEETVKKRTRTIEKVYDELKMKEAQILQQEKMASIGVLVAGIAHEINNPIGYINSNLETLQGELQDILHYTREAEKTLADNESEPNREEKERKTERLRKIRSEMKLDTLLPDIEQNIKESKQGVDRIKKIIIDLKKFSHADENKLALADINQEIESTLNIVWNELKYKAKITKELGALPPVECFPQQLNQVFMNILVNAVQAIPDQGTISIQTFLKGDLIHVIFRDSGVGIPPENLKKIFDPFFTTKEIGKGTGLGLYIAYEIIEKHHGKISVESEVGKGTSFTIQLPTHPALSSVEAGVSSA